MHDSVQGVIILLCTVLNQHQTIILVFQFIAVIQLDWYGMFTFLNYISLTKFCYCPELGTVPELETFTVIHCCVIDSFISSINLRKIFSNTIHQSPFTLHILMLFTTSPLQLIIHFLCYLRQPNLFNNLELYCTKYSFFASQIQKYFFRYRNVSQIILVYIFSLHLKLL